MATLGLSLLIVLSLFNVAVTDPVFAYGENGEINIRKITSGMTVKTFKIAEYDDMYIAIHYKQDLIFYAKDKKVYRIHLLDDNGDRKISGKGELFNNPNADHSEVLISTLADSVSGITINEADNKLYIAGYREIKEYDLDVKQEKVVVKAGSMRSPVYYDGALYFSNAPTWKTSNICRAKLNGKRSVDSYEELLKPIQGDILTIAIDPGMKKLFYRVGTVISVLSIDLPSTSYPLTDTKVVLSNSKYTGGYGLLAIAIKNHYLLWIDRSSSWGKIYMGVLNQAKTYIPSKNVYHFGEGPYNFRPYGIVVFDLKLTSKPPKPMSTPKLCTC